MPKENLCVVCCWQIFPAMCVSKSCVLCRWGCECPELINYSGNVLVNANAFVNADDL